MASEAFEKWWSEKPVSARLGAVHGSGGDLAEEAWAAAVEACAAEVEGETCICAILEMAGEFYGGRSGEFLVHDARCPVALAARLRRLA